MRCYRLKHIPSGLYYIPSREIQIKLPEYKFSRYVKSNLSKKGKTYLQQPSMKWIGSSFYNHLQFTSDIREYFAQHGTSSYYSGNYSLVKFRQEEWEIEEVK